MSEQTALQAPSKLFCLLRLHPGELATLSPRRIAALTVEDGRAWITKRGDSADLVVDAGHRLEVAAESRSLHISSFDAGHCTTLRVEFRPATASWRLRLARRLLDIGANRPASIPIGENP